jgi:hypothetical protein
MVTTLRAVCEDVATCWRAGALFAALEVVFGGLFDALIWRGVDLRSLQLLTTRREPAE